MPAIVMFGVVIKKNDKMYDILDRYSEENVEEYEKLFDDDYIVHDGIEEEYFVVGVPLSKLFRFSEKQFEEIDLTDIETHKDNTIASLKNDEIKNELMRREWKLISFLHYS